MLFRDGIHRSWFDMTIVRDVYRDWSIKCDIPMHRDIIIRFIETIAIIMSPIIPHWSELIWSLITPFSSTHHNNKCESVCNAKWPLFTPFDRNIRKQFIFFRDFLRNTRLQIMKTKTFKPNQKTSAYIIVASTYEPSKIIMLNYLTDIYQKNNNTFPSDLTAQMKIFVSTNPQFTSEDKKTMMQFGAFMRDETIERGIDALAIELVFDQKQILQDNIVFIQQSLDLANVTIFNNDEEIPGGKKKKDEAVPGKPIVQFL